MRIRRFLVREFKNLRNVELDFADEFTTVLVGRNGSGKSNVLEALILAFRDLDLGRPPAFAYALEYTCRGANVAVDADPRRAAGTVRITVDGQRVKREAFARRGGTGGRYLPSHVFGYYSGPTNRMEQHFALHQKAFAKALLDNQDAALRPMFYVREVHSHFVLLSFFQHEGQERSLVRDRLGIEDLESVLFALRKPDWAKGRKPRGKSSGASSVGDDTFWGAGGVVRTLLERLYELSLAPLRTGNGERLYLYLESKAKLEELAAHYRGSGADGEEFFKALESLYVSNLIENVYTRVRVGGAEDPLTFRELSEGEQQLLMVLGILQFVQRTESLFLLDEPDTHLNPAWSLEYTALLRAAVGGAKGDDSSQIIMASHEPLAIASLGRSEVLLISRDEDTRRVEARHPDEDPQGMGVAGLLTSDVYGLRSDLDLVTLRELDELRALSMKAELSPGELARMTELNQRLEYKAFTETTRDPLYRLFAMAMGRLEREAGLDRPVLSPTEVEQRNDAAVEIARLVRARYDAQNTSEDSDDNDNTAANDPFSDPSDEAERTADEIARSARATLDGARHLGAGSIDAAVREGGAATPASARTERDGSPHSAD